MKRRLDGEVDPVPSKRIFYSIITDYDLNRAVCELIDNAIDEWVRGGRKRALVVDLEFDKQQQSIEIRDNAGGVDRDEIHILIGPGHSSSSTEEALIGYFGVGTKRAVVALAEHVVFQTARDGKPTYEMVLDEPWLGTEEWRLPVYEVDPIASGSTRIRLSQLRIAIDDDTLERLRLHLSESYALFIGKRSMTLRVDGKPVAPLLFENWGYPADYSPRRFVGDLHLPGGRVVAISATVGLSSSSSPGTGDYGLFCYCNDRLIARAVKSHHVGFDRGNIGFPHPEISILRCVVRLNGSTEDMPWNSSKSALNYNHRVFIALRSWLIDRMKEYAAVARRLAEGGQWEKEVFRHKSGTIEEVFVEDFPTAKKNYLPKLPPRSAPAMTPLRANREVITEKPWTRGLLGALSALPHLTDAKLHDGNRIALIVLDSTLEIAFKEFLVNESGRAYSDAQLKTLFSRRQSVHEEVAKHNPMTRNFWKKVDFYYAIRCKLIHEKASVAVTSEEIEDFRQVVGTALTKLFDLRIP